MARGDASGAQRFTWRLQIGDAEGEEAGLQTAGGAGDWPELERGLMAAFADARRRFGEAGDEEDGWELRPPTPPAPPARRG